MKSVVRGRMALYIFLDAEVTRDYDLDTFTEPAQADELVERF